MFGGGFAPPQLSKEEMSMLETEANVNVKAWAATAIVLYISPFLVDAVTGLF
ncbi:mitochondrial outer membrane translocase complex, subunit Tom5 [Xylariaceae sp. FL1019]|nr:mitochondrial outer membrane translocase complex, subunit Tom5 [Xylariaceae sp. FL1019]